MPVAKALWLLDDCAKNMRSNRTHSGNALKLAYLPKGCANSFDFFEGLLPLQKRVIKLSVEPAHHPPFLFGRQLLEILLAPFSRKHFDPVQAQHTPATIACFDQRPELPLRIAPVQELINQGALNLTGAILSHPHFFELA